MSASGGADPLRGNASLEQLFATLRKQSSELSSPVPSPNPDPVSTSIFNQHQFQQGQSRAVSHSASSNPMSFAFGSFGNASPQPTSLSYHPVSVSSPIESPGPIGRQSRHEPAVMSPASSTPAVSSPGPGVGQASSDRAANLLNLLKFAQPASTPRPAPTPPQSQLRTEAAAPREHNDGAAPTTADEEQKPQGQAISASDLVASIMGTAGTPGPRASPSPSPFIGPPKAETPNEAAETPASASTATRPQDLLLELLSRSKPAQGGTTPSRQVSAGGVLPPRAAPGASAAVDRLSQELASTSLDKNALASKENRAGTPARSLTSPAHQADERARKPSGSLPPTQSWPRSSQQLGHAHDPLTPASPRDRPRAESSRPSATPTYNILKRPGSSDPERLTGESHKRKSKESSPGSEHAASRRKLVPSSDRVSSTRSSPRPGPSSGAGLGASKPVTGIVTADKNPETVAEALKEVAEKVDREVEDALANVNGRADATNKNGAAGPVGDRRGELERKAKSAASEVNDEDEDAEEDEGEEVDDDDEGEAEKFEEKADVEEAKPSVRASAAADVPGPAANEPAGDSWESGDAEDSPTKEEERVVRVYNFPMEPFVSLALKPAPARVVVSFPRENILDIARLKKEFDQIDRTLATASKQYIMYAMVKHGGFRIIRQDDGRDHQVFGDSGDRIFNLVSSTRPAGDSSVDGEAVFGTGVSGSVYWVGLAGPEKDFWRDEEVESHGFIFPPISTQEEQTFGGGQLKTRVKKSARHPEYFAIGRGKAIYIIWPAVAQHPKFLRNKKERTVDVDKYIAGRCLKIATGKAGKDFTFSEDDTTIVSLDKAGRLRIWDVRRLVDEANGEIRDTGTAKIPPVEIKTPLMTFLTTPPSERAWPSSVLFVDRHKVYAKGIAARYLIVGMKQNHTLQLWDLALAKPVQEVHFPHENESDAICSISYHSSSGILIVGHPTRNSIYFLTLSAPKYLLPAMSQATYIERLARNHPSTPKPDATAIMTGIREYSLGSMGQLRSVDVLSQPSSGAGDAESPILFELYVMHSKGVSCISVKAEDLGWSKDSRVLHPADAVDEKLVAVEALRPLPQTFVVEDAEAASGKTETSTVAPTNMSKSAPKEALKKPATAQGRVNESPTRKMPSSAAPIAREAKVEIPRSILSNGAAKEQSGTVAEKMEKKKKKRPGVGDMSWRSKDEKAAQTPGPSIAPLPHTQTAQRTKPLESPTRSKPDAGSRFVKGDPATAGDTPLASPTKARLSTQTLAETPSVPPGASGNDVETGTDRIKQTVSAEFGKFVSAELGKLHRRIDEDRRIQQATFDTKLEAVLRLVSSILTDNTEKALARIIEQSIDKSVLPAIREMTAKVLDRGLNDVLREQTRETVAREVTRGFPDGIRKALESPDSLQMMSDLVANKVATHVESEFAAVVHGTITPVFKEFTLSTVKRMAEHVEGRVADQINRLEERRRDDSQKLDGLQDVTRGLAQMLSRMAAAQTDFQHEILRLQRQPLQAGDSREQAQQDLSSARVRSQARSSHAQAGSVRSVSSQATPVCSGSRHATPAPVSAVQSTLSATLPPDPLQPALGQSTSVEGSMYAPFSPVAASPMQSSTGHPRTGHTLPSRMSTSTTTSPEQAEMDLITGLLRDGRYEEATLKWLQSRQQVAIFNKLFILINPTYMQNLSALVVLSVAATIASTFESHVAERIQWLECCLAYLNTRNHLHDGEVRELIPRIMDILVERLEGLYVELAKESLHDPILGRIPTLTSRARQIQQMV